MATNPDKPGIKIPIPRHKKEIPIGTLNNILKAAGLK
ncbi:type II toxin-antitoxin system HicA family toxin [Syntrophomonas wolfei]|nr:type II toxin-antitoxin system HicA family toxin [Syntrophomonas wolfei]